MNKAYAKLNHYSFGVAFYFSYAYLTVAKFIDK